MLVHKHLICPSKPMWSNFPWSSPWHHPFSISDFLVQSQEAYLFWSAILSHINLSYISLSHQKVSGGGGGGKFFKYFVLKDIDAASQMCNSCMCCSHVISGGAWVFTQVHSHVVCIPKFVTQFINFHAETFPFRGDILPKDNSALEFYNYLVQCQTHRGVIEFSKAWFSVSEAVLVFHSWSYSSPWLGLSELFAKGKKCSMCKNLSHVMVSP
jgi:hypothetical protein